MNRNRLDIQASIDLEGLKTLQEMLIKYQGILEMMTPPMSDWYLMVRAVGKPGPTEMKEVAN